MNYEFMTKLWEYNGQGAWHFVTLPKNISDEIKLISEPRKGFGSVRVKVTIGTSNWSTSVFPDSKSGCYVLPVKKEVRTKEKIADGDQVRVAVVLEV